MITPPFFSSKELKIFLTFFIIYSFFIHWTGWVEDSHLALTRSIVDDQRFEINSYYNITGDRAYFDSDYYSNKAPGLSILSIPVYSAWKLIYVFFLPDSSKEVNFWDDGHLVKSFFGEQIITLINPGIFTLFSMILVTIFTSSLFSALTVILIYKISRYFTKKESDRLLIVLIYGLGTLAFPFATVYFSHATATFFIFLSFYLLFKVKNEKLSDMRLILLGGIFAGFAVVVDYIVILIVMALVGFTLSIKRKNTTLFYVVSIFAGLMSLLLYNLLIFGTPFELTINHSDSALFPSRFDMNLPELPLILQMLILPYRGLLFYSPVLILSFIGLFYMYKEHKLETVVITLIFTSFLFVFSMMVGWWGGTSYGMRYMLPVIPFLMLPLIYIFKKLNFRLIIILVTLSIFVNILGLQTWENNIIDGNNILINDTFQEKIDNIQFLYNPLYDYYLPLFLKNGPRSRIFEHLINGDMNIDIRDTDFSKPHMKDRIFLFTLNPFGFILLKTQFLSMIFLGIIIFIIWKKEIIEFLIHKINLSYNHMRFIGIIMLFIFLASFIESTHTYHAENFYSKEKSGELDYRWISNNATIFVYSSTPKFAYLDFIVDSYRYSRNMSININDMFISTFKVEKNGTYFSTPVLNLNKGKNKVLLYSGDDCTNVYKIEQNTDIRCLSFTLRNKDHVNEDLFVESSMDSGWYDKETVDTKSFRWMSQNATFSIITTDSHPIKARLEFVVDNYYKSKILQLYINSNFIGQYHLSRGEYIITPLFDLNPKQNTLFFISKEGCAVPNETDDSADLRCLSFAFENIRLVLDG